MKNNQIKNYYFDLVQVGFFDNALINNSNSKLIEVYDLGSGPFTGILNLSFIMNVSSGVYNIGIRLESTTNVSSIFWLQLVVLNPNVKITTKRNPIGSKPLGAESDEEETEPVVTVDPTVDVTETANSNNSTLITRKEKKEEDND